MSDRDMIFEKQWLINHHKSVKKQNSNLSSQFLFVSKMMKISFMNTNLLTLFYIKLKYLKDTKKAIKKTFSELQILINKQKQEKKHTKKYKNLAKLEKK